jgi:tetratricopeptide (TPR) repeat protein
VSDSSSVLSDTLPARPRDTHDAAFGSTIGRYLILNVLGRGGMGIVYSAYDPVLDRRIAVKLLQAFSGDDATEGRARMQREAQALAKLSHPNVIVVHDVAEHAGTLYIAMELVDGTTMREFQADRPWREIVDAYTDAGRGLAAAHAAGLVHRDFKPENVLVGTDRRVRVTDFGLARRVDGPDAPADGTSTLGSNLTADGAVMGTPTYMAPEQIDGGVVDARSDQFSWCIAVWEAIYGSQPFPGTNLALRSAAMKAEPPKLPAKTSVPRSVGRVLLRGLAAEPAERWPSLDALLGALRTATSRRNKVAMAGAVIAAVIALVVVFVAGRHAREAASCDDAGQPIASLWSPEIKDSVSRAFAATGVPFASDAVASVDRAIKSWRDRWRDLAVDSCKSTRSGNQSEAMLDQRSACLVRRRDELQGMLAALQHADAKRVEAAADMVTWRLPDLDACRDTEVLAGIAPAPSDPANRRAPLEAELESLETETIAGLTIDRAKQLAPRASDDVKTARTIGWAPLVARARRDLAHVQRELGHGKDARSTLLAAAGSAAAGGDFDGLVDIYLDLLDVEIHLTSDYQLGEGWASLAEGTLSRLGPRVDKQLLLGRSRGIAAQKAGHLDEARKTFLELLDAAHARNPNDEITVLGDLVLVESDMGELDAARGHLDRAMTLAKVELGPDHPRIASLENSLGIILYRQGNYAASEKALQRALADRVRALGNDDVAVALTLESLGLAELAQDRLGDAQPHLERALSILISRLGPNHVDVANAMNDIGGAYHRAGLYERALDINKRALAIREHALAPDHPDIAQSLVNIAIESKALGRFEAVDPSYRRAIPMFEKAYGVDSFEAGVSHLNFAEALRVEGKLDDAQTEYEHARASWTKAIGADHPALAHVWNGLGQLELARGHAAKAVPLLERAVAMREKDPSDATALAESRFALARALGPGDRARQLATAARDAYRQAGKPFATELAAVEAWLR